MQVDITENKRPRVYVAGAYSANNPIDMFNNMRRGIKAAKDVLLAGYAPFCPWLDHHFQLQLQEHENLMIEDYYSYSLAWLEASEAVYVIPGWENSRGTIAEIKRAKELNIPIFYSLDDLRKGVPICTR